MGKYGSAQISTTSNPDISKVLYIIEDINSFRMIPKLCKNSTSRIFDFPIHARFVQGLTPKRSRLVSPCVEGTLGLWAFALEAASLAQAQFTVLQRLLMPQLCRVREVPKRESLWNRRNLSE